MRKTRTAMLALVSGLLALVALPTFAQSTGSSTPAPHNSNSSQRHRFELSAAVTAHIPGTHDGTNAPGAGGQAGGRASDRFGVDGNQIASIAGVPKKDDTEVPGKIDEYNVDWSRWISAQADRWYYLLKTAENCFGLQFVSVRPAMIQFTCYADGTIGNIVLRQSSGVPVYDRLQIETLRATQPLQPFPAGTHRNSITLCQGWESHPKQPGESDFQPGTFGRDFPMERVRQWRSGR